MKEKEAQTRHDLIDPALRKAGWGASVTPASRVVCEYPISPGKVTRGTRKNVALSADYMLEYKGKRLAIIEAKPRTSYYTEGVGQAKHYAQKTSIRFAYATNGERIYEIDMHTGSERDVDSFPSPNALWQMTYDTPNPWREAFQAIPYPDKSGTWNIRYYQQAAVEAATDAIAAGKQRMLLNLATGTGKTSIAFHIAWKLFTANWNIKQDVRRAPRILFLADRNTLADQAFNDFNAFAMFDDDAMCRITPDDIRKKGRVPKNANIFFTIFQTFMSSDGESYYFGDYPQDFFDCIIIDECHRGGAKDESTWRGIMEHFAPAVQIGLTATPKRKYNADTYAYFGEPIYTYALKDGINDGFLTPFRVREYATTLDDYVYTDDDDIVEGEVQEGKRYTESDFNRIIEIKEREAARVRFFMDAIPSHEKTIVFCATQLHAMAIRDLINQNKPKGAPTDYCARVKADDGKIGEQHLEAFKDNEKHIPSVLTTSQKLSTGVDARNVRHIVLMRPMRSMIEFKQIIGRGTRLYDDKYYFTVHDFVRAYHHFEDPEWDGEPLEPVAPKPLNSKEDVAENEEPPADDVLNGEEEPDVKKMLKVTLADGKALNIKHIASTSFWDASGKPISAQAFLKKLYGDIPELFKDEDELRRLWSNPATRQELLTQLDAKGYGTEQLEDIKKLVNADHSDIFDVLAYIAYSKAPIARQDRVNERKTTIFSNYKDKEQEFIDFILSQYVKLGSSELSPEKLPDLIRLKYNDVQDAISTFGDVTTIKHIFTDFQQHLYNSKEI